MNLYKYTVFLYIRKSMIHDTTIATMIAIRTGTINQLLF
jgi:hypothetical protein